MDINSWIPASFFENLESIKIVGHEFIPNFIAYLINIASGERSAALEEDRRDRLAKILEEDSNLRDALSVTKTLREDISKTCSELFKRRSNFLIPASQQDVWELLNDEIFQFELSEWFLAGSAEEGNDAKLKILRRIGNENSIEVNENDFLSMIEKSLFSNPVVARWKYNLSLNYIREQLSALHRTVEESSGIYNARRQNDAIEAYCKKALDAWDIIDLTNLPEGDVDIATQKLLLRQLYMPLRIEMAERQISDSAVSEFEVRRDARRLIQAGRYAEDDFQSDARKSVGSCLGEFRRLVILGDPGGGKTTMLRWIATAYLLAQRRDSSFAQLPDTDSLPVSQWIPVLIRCRDLGEDDLCRSFVDFLKQHLRKSELQHEEADIMQSVVLDRIKKGEILLLVDGLDEITNPAVRMQFCQELERTSVRYPRAPIVVTSRIVGYRDMPYRMGSGFRHGVVAELNRKDKDIFARHWIEVTEQHHQRPERERKTKELIEALHSSDRIERLTGNPMLLTTLALVKRKVGKLPNRRNKLYAEAVSVLLNWNPRLYNTIDEAEAMPQLEYIAYEMCRRGVQRLPEEEILDLLDRVRSEYKNIRAIRERPSGVFLRHLEERSSILIKSGSFWQKDADRGTAVWEFRHLTFQEYLAAKALIDGRYPDRGKPLSLASEIAPLAKAVREGSNPRGNKGRQLSGEEFDVPESWREALRLVVADCKDDYVDDVVQAILNPTQEEDELVGSKPRAVLAALCLADEPNVTESTANLVLTIFAKAVNSADGKGQKSSSIDRAAIEVARSSWGPLFRQCMIKEFSERDMSTGWNVGGVCAMTECTLKESQGIPLDIILTKLVEELSSDDRSIAILASLTIMGFAFEGRIVKTDKLVERLILLLASSDEHVSYAASWALGWLNRPSFKENQEKWLWSPSGEELDHILIAFESSCSGNFEKGKWLARIMGNKGTKGVISLFVKKLPGSSIEMKEAIIYELGNIAEPSSRRDIIDQLYTESVTVIEAAIIAIGKFKATSPPELFGFLDHANINIRRLTVESIGKTGDNSAAIALSRRLDDDPSVRSAAIIGLAKLGGLEATSSLVEILGNYDESVDEEIIDSISRLKIDTVTQLLRERLGNVDSNKRFATIKALTRQNPAEASLLFLPNLNKYSAREKLEILEGLKSISSVPLVYEFIDPLRKELRHGDSHTQILATKILGIHRDKSAIEDFIFLLDSSDTSVSVMASATLRELNEPAGSKRFLEFLTSRDADIRKLAVESYAYFCDEISSGLLSVDLDGRRPWRDPRHRYSSNLIISASKALNATIKNIRARLRKIEKDFGMTLR